MAAKTIPWGSGEYCHVNGMRCVYEKPKYRATIDDLIIHLPGGFGAPIRILKMMGYMIVPPAEIRTSDYA